MRGKLGDKARLSHILDAINEINFPLQIAKLIFKIFL
jgi:hypothetical protein